MVRKVEKKNIIAITICYNDDYKFNEWVSHYEAYKNSIYKLIIVDNGSKKEFLDKVKKNFSEAIIIERKVNGGCTAAYNDGIRCALDDPCMDAIMLIGNDILIYNKDVKKLSDLLFSQNQIGMVAPVLLKKNSDIIEDAGSGISFCLFMKPENVGKKYSDIEKKAFVVQSVTGGMNLAKREFYEKIGVQDENLFMYSDEVDIGIRSKKAGFKMYIDGNAYAIHQHINPEAKEKRMPYSDFLIARNKVYLGKKFYGKGRAFIIMLYMLARGICKILVSLFKKRNLRPYVFSIRGALKGFKGDMKLPNYLNIR